MLGSELQNPESFLVDTEVQGCVKEVRNLVNHPIVRLLGTRVDSTRVKVITQRVYLKLPATTTREGLLRNH